MFDLNQWPILWTITHRFRSNMYIPVYHTNKKYDRCGQESPSGYGPLHGEILFPLRKFNIATVCLKMVLTEIIE